MKLIGKKFREMSNEEVRKVINYVHANNGPYRFTVDEITKEDALNLLNIAYTFDVAEIVPEEYLDDKDFMIEFVKRKHPLTYPSSTKYASDKLKNDPEFVSFCINRHGYAAIMELKTKDGKVSKLLLDKKFLATEIRKDRYKEEDVKGEKREVLDPRAKENIAIYLAEYSPAIQANKALMMEVISLNPKAYMYAEEEIAEDEQVLINFFKSALEKNYISTRIFGSINTKDKRILKLKRLYEKVAELPYDAKLRKALYKKLAQIMVQKIEKTNEEDLMV